MTGKFDRWEKIAAAWSNWLNWVAGIGLVLMLCLTAADVVGIKLAQLGAPFFRPIPGAIEVVAFLGVVVTGFAIAHTQVLRGHIQVEFFVQRLSPRPRAAVTAFVLFLSLAVFILLAWQSVEYGLSLQAKGTVSMTQRIPYYPFVHALAFCCLPVCLVLTLEFIRSLVKAVRR